MRTEPDRPTPGIGRDTTDPRTIVPGPGRHSLALDGLRGLAVLFVLVFHIIQVEAEPPEGIARIAYKATRIGQTGVDLFFVLSGFLITGILQDTRGSAGYFRNFYGRRTLRIFPLYYGVLIVATVILPAIIGHRVTDANPLALWTYTANIPPMFGHHSKTFGHFWTLAVEEQFYLVWPAVVFAFARPMLMKVCVGCMVGSVFVRIALLAMGLSANPFTLGRLDALALGGLLALMARGDRGMAGWRKGAGVVLAAMVVCIVPMYVAKTGSHEAWLQVIKFSLLAILYGALLALAVASPPTTLIGRFFGLGPLRFAGKYSYGIYIFHPMLIDAFKSARASDAAGAAESPELVIFRAVAIAGLSILAAWLSYHLFEKRFLNWKRYFEYDREPTPAPVAVAAPGLAIGG